MDKCLELGICGYYHDFNADEPCRHGQVMLGGFQFGDTIPGHKEDKKHIAENCGWCLLYGNTQPLTKDNRRCDFCSRGHHGACKKTCGCACVPSLTVMK